MPRTKQSLWLAVACMGLLAPMHAMANDAFEKKAKELATLRTEVKKMSSRLQDKRASFLSRQRSLEAQKANAELQLRRKQKQLDSIQKNTEELGKKLTSSSLESDLRQTIEKFIPQLKKSIQTSLPYRQKERLEAVDELSKDLAKESEKPSQIAGRLWTLLEDEKRLAKENQIDRQLIEIDGKKQLVDVLHIGMVALFFQTPDGKTGYFQNGWHLSQNQQHQQISELFKAVQKGIRSGRFLVPQPWNMK